MKNYSIDAIKIAKSIQKNNLSFLRGQEFKMRDKIKKRKGRSKHMKKPKKERMTLAKLAKIVENGFKRIDTRLDYIVKANNLKDLPKSK